MRPMEMDLTAEPYTGPVPIVTHVHGAHTTEESDGYAEAWFLPAAQNIPASYATEGTWYNNFKMQAANKGFVAPGTTAWEPGTSVFQYPNDQAATTLWYHDHTLGMTRLNVYAGPAGFYLLRGGPTDGVKGKLPGPAPALPRSPWKAVL
jgi:spore coat protein A, manganese oxidase